MYASEDVRILFKYLNGQTICFFAVMIGCCQRFTTMTTSNVSDNILGKKEHTPEEKKSDDQVD